MTDEEFQKELQDLVEMLESLYRIKDRNRTKWLKDEIRIHLIEILSKL